jgi:hypothetical protein
MKVTIERFKNAFGETRYRFAMPSVFRPGQLSRTRKSWRTYSGAYKASKWLRDAIKNMKERENGPFGSQ